MVSDHVRGEKERLGRASPDFVCGCLTHPLSCRKRTEPTLSMLAAVRTRPRRCLEGRGRMRAMSSFRDSLSYCFHSRHKSLSIPLASAPYRARSQFGECHSKRRTENERLLQIPHKPYPYLTYKAHNLPLHGKSFNRISEKREGWILDPGE